MISTNRYLTEEIQEEPYTSRFGALRFPVLGQPHPLTSGAVQPFLEISSAAKRKMCLAPFPRSRTTRRWRRSYPRSPRTTPFAKRFGSSTVRTSCSGSLRVRGLAWRGGGGGAGARVPPPGSQEPLVAVSYKNGAVPALGCFTFHKKEKDQ